MGEYRGGAAADESASHDRDEEHAATTHHEATPHESPPVMTHPLIALAVMAIIGGLFNLPWKFAGLDHEIEHLLVGALPDAELVEEATFRFGVAAVSSAVAISGIALAFVIYGAKIVPSSLLARLFRPVHVLLENKYYADVLYERVLVGFVFYQVIGGALAVFDRVVIDGAVNGIGRGARQSASVLRYVQSGQFQTYGAVAFSGLVFMTIVVLVLSPL
jgi:NADH:ubiquinone oxidoreductase subunit 5 (subunit L)/multisubunit Na+/H+ antiporter MnhA subunit